jgi:hypothetical protein
VQGHALLRERAEVDVVAPAAAGHVVVGPVVTALVAELEGGSVVVAHLLKPRDGVAPTVATGGPRGGPDGQVHPAARHVQVLRDLDARLAGADHQHVPGGQILGATVGGRVQLREPRRQRLGQRRRPGNVVAAGRDNDLVGHEVATAGLEPEAGIEAADGGLLTDRRREAGQVVAQPVVHLVAEHEALVVTGVVGLARQAALEVRRDQAEGVPAPVDPVMAGGLALQDHVIDPLLAQQVGHRQPCLAAPDDRDLRVLGHTDTSRP